PEKANAEEYECHPSASPATTIRVQSPGTAENFGAPAASVITCRTCPRDTRSTRSVGCSSVEAGMITAPSFIVARMISHSGTTLPSISSTRSPRATPSPRSQPATCDDRSDSDPYDSETSDPSSARIRSAGGYGSSAAITSNQSSAQLNSSSAGQRNERRAAS